MEKQANLFAMIDEATEKKYYLKIKPFKISRFHAALMRLVIADDDFYQKIVKEYMKNEEYNVIIEGRDA